jgi:hypothetical protein
MSIVLLRYILNHYSECFFFFPFSLLWVRIQYVMVDLLTYLFSSSSSFSNILIFVFGGGGDEVYLLEFRIYQIFEVWGNLGVGGFLGSVWFG